jgi:hypothetical protein
LINGDMNGEGTPGDIIKLYDGSSLFGSTAFTAGGWWTLQPTSPLAVGAHSLTVTETNKYGAESLYSIATDFTVVDAVGPVVRHITIGEYDAFAGTPGTNQTIDLSADPAAYFREPTAHTQGGAGGIDTLHLMGDHQVLDLSSLTGKTAAAKLSGIQVIDLSGHTNTLKFSLTDVLNLGEQNLFLCDGRVQMKVNGLNADRVDLSNAHIAGVADGLWQQEDATRVVGALTYNATSTRARTRNCWFSRACRSPCITPERRLARPSLSGCMKGSPVVANPSGTSSRKTSGGSRRYCAPLHGVTQVATGNTIAWSFYIRRQKPHERYQYVQHA